MYKVVKPFKYAYDGINVVSFDRGDIFEYDAINGLVDDGFLKKIKSETKIIEDIEVKASIDDSVETETEIEVEVETEKDKGE